MNIQSQRGGPRRRMAQHAHNKRAGLTHENNLHPCRVGVFPTVAMALRKYKINRPNGVGYCMDLDDRIFLRLAGLVPTNNRDREILLNAVLQTAPLHDVPVTQRYEQAANPFAYNTSNRGWRNVRTTMQAMDNLARALADAYGPLCGYQSVLRRPKYTKVAGLSDRQVDRVVKALGLDALENNKIMSIVENYRRLNLIGPASPEPEAKAAEGEGAAEPPADRAVIARAADEEKKRKIVREVRKAIMQAGGDMNKYDALESAFVSRILGDHEQPGSDEKAVDAETIAVLSALVAGGGNASDANIAMLLAQKTPSNLTPLLLSGSIRKGNAEDMIMAAKLQDGFPGDMSATAYLGALRGRGQTKLSTYATFLLASKNEKDETTLSALLANVLGDDADARDIMSKIMSVNDQMITKDILRISNTRNDALAENLTPEQRTKAREVERAQFERAFKGSGMRNLVNSLFNTADASGLRQLVATKMTPDESASDKRVVESLVQPVDEDPMNAYLSVLPNIDGSGLRLQCKGSSSGTLDQLHNRAIRDATRGNFASAKSTIDAIGRNIAMIV